MLGQAGPDLLGDHHVLHLGQEVLGLLEPEAERLGPKSASLEFGHLVHRLLCLLVPLDHHLQLDPHARLLARKCSAKSLVGRPPVEAIELDPDPELLELVAQVVDVVRTVADGFDDLDQPLGEAEGCVMLLKLHEAPGTSALLWTAGQCTPGTALQSPRARSPPPARRGASRR